MGDKTGISWTDATWNPVRGCSRVSEGCRNCYAEKVAARFSGPGQPYEGLADRTRKGSKWTGDVRVIPEHLADPLRWKAPRRIFVNSMSDLFHEKLTNEEIATVFGVMASCPQHTFQVLTKRAKRMREWFRWADDEGKKHDLLVFKPRALLTCAWAACAGDAWGDVEPHEKLGSLPSREVFGSAWPLPNVWLGVSVENQDAADERVPELLKTPAAVRFLSCEPLIGPVDLAKASPNARSLIEDLDWLIAGCESGPGARACDVDWLRSLRDQCLAANVPIWVKQAAPAQGTWASGAPRPAPIDIGPGAKHKAGSVIELPYLDGFQYKEFPGG